MKHALPDTFKLTITCLPGLEKLLYEEVKSLGGSDVIERRRAVSCTGDLATLYNLNLHCRVALRVLLHLEHHKVQSEEDVYRAVNSIYWQKYFNAHHTFAVRCAFGRHSFKNTHFITLKSKDAVADRFRTALGQRPSVDKKNPDISIFVYIDSGNMDIYLDSSGYSLHKRGYKRFLGAASINETLAAAMFQWSDFKNGQSIINPMCGVGTIAIEACMAANGISVQSERDRFAFKNWGNYNAELLKSINNANSGDTQVHSSDIEQISVSECRENIFNAGMSKLIHCEKEDFFELKPVENALLLLNPPYDKRMKEKDIVGFYKKIGDTLKFKWKNCRCVIISANLEAFKFIGLKPNKKHKVFNGSLPAEVRVFDIY